VFRVNEERSACIEFPATCRCPRSARDLRHLMQPGLPFPLKVGMGRTPLPPQGWDGANSPSPSRLGWGELPFPLKVGMGRTPLPPQGESWDGANSPSPSRGRLGWGWGMPDRVSPFTFPLSSFLSPLSPAAGRHVRHGLFAFPTVTIVTALPTVTAFPTVTSVTAFSPFRPSRSSRPFRPSRFLRRHGSTSSVPDRRSCAAPSPPAPCISRRSRR
jgi:hypothetical protein